MQAYFVIVQNVIGERDQNGKPLLYKVFFFLFFFGPLYIKLPQNSLKKRGKK